MHKIKLKKLSLKNRNQTTQLMLKLWPSCSFKKEYKNCKRILLSKKEKIQLVKVDGQYVGFIYLSLRTDYVSGTQSSPVAYIEGLYVKPKYQKKGIGKKLVQFGAKWGYKRGAKEYGSDTEIENKSSIVFHKKSGFKEVNRIVSFVQPIK